jgi:hypothetical protein
MKKPKPAGSTDKPKDAAPEVVEERDEDDDEPEKVRNYARGRGSSAPVEEAKKLYAEIYKAFDNKTDQYFDNKDYWNIYNAILDENQSYSGFTDVYDPVVRDAVNSRTRRRLMQLFPANGIHVSAISPDNNPKAHMALLEHYIRKTELREVVKQDLVAGDVTGQWCLLVTWEKDSFSIRELVRKHPAFSDDDDLEDESSDYEDVIDDEVVNEGPQIDPFPVDDLAVIPPTVNKLERAKIVAIKLRASREAVEKMMDKGWLLEKDVEKLMKKWDNKTDVRKQRSEDAGVKVEGTDTYALIYLAWTKLTLEKERVPALIFFTGPAEVGGIIRNPNWSGRPNVFSAAVDKVPGAFNGRSKIAPVKTLQWMVNDALSMGSDSTKYSLLPLSTVDPMKVPNYSLMTMGLAAVWPVPPDSIKFQTFPQLFAAAMEVVNFLKAQIWESMDVNEMQFGKTQGGRRNNQQMALAAAESQVPVMDDSKRYEQCILEPVCEFMLELDLINRTDAVTVAMFGELGIKARMETIKPQRVSQRLFIQWQGTEYQASLQRIQQQIGFLNVVNGIDPKKLNGRRVDMGPLVDTAAQLLFGAQVAPSVIIDERDLFNIDPHEENAMLLNGLTLEVHISDNDPEHLKVHHTGMIESGDPGGHIKAHAARHLLQLYKKMAEAGPMSQGRPGVPGGQLPGGGAAPGVAGAPRQGALPSAPRNVQNPAGAVHGDQIADAAVPGRE